jgi:hypothetical protein
LNIDQYLTLVWIAGGTLRVIAQDVAQTNPVYLKNDSTPLNTWVQVCCSWNAGTAVQMYVNGSSANTTILGNTNSTLNPSAASSIGDLYGGGLPSAASDLGQVWYNDSFIDFSNPANLAKFYSSGPVSVGSDGSTPTGSAPRLFLDGAVGSWLTNKGSVSASFALSAGSIAASSGNPP